ncbi:MAG: hypothetical protein A2817_01355 [Candidatus Yanofskybacteria bacterium RIFCSPHIGHO2_01_FULL_39_8b]|uniref:Reverse transcriptase domain-containing protein n=1 Tax=Candidatus Yanofskybacteria bacterium RIFCSPHIGHO2_01_FULL_39_8b TaxID=1802659 RepID=A0A1F8E8Q9_9BACT|nr:MAG: hypothetical protein A2817_01355 [Candidatus Yanofskybacteria bacterium RIFCSPHIGHO2_01_FULL_39_8b]
MKRQLCHTYQDIISLENLLLAWEEFIKGKKKRRDVQEFSFNLFDNIILLYEELANQTYRHGGYEAFRINDPKPRDIHKASVRDRLLHHAIYRILYPFFDRLFVTDSYSCRVDKGTHKAIERFRQMSYKASRNNTKTCWVLKCDIKKFFATIDHDILLTILREYIFDKDILYLLREVIDSFETATGKGLPLGNLTSQLLVNIYMNRFDQFIKHTLKAQYYIRYADDFVFLSNNKDCLNAILPQIKKFLFQELKLQLHPQKIFIKTLASGIDYLGWVNFPYHRVLRTATKRRMMRRVQEHLTQKTMQSYLGLLKHGNTFRLRNEVLNKYWLWGNM